MSLSAEPDPRFGATASSDRRQTTQGRNWLQILHHYMKANESRRRMNHASRRIAKPTEAEESIEQSPPPDKRQLMVMTNQKCSLSASESGGKDSSKNRGNFSNWTSCRASSSQSTSHNFDDDDETDESEDDEGEWTWSGRRVMSSWSATTSRSIAAKSVQPGQLRKHVTRWTSHRKLRRCKRCEFAESYLLAQAEQQTTTDNIFQQQVKLPRKEEHRIDKFEDAREENEERRREEFDECNLRIKSDKSYQVMHPIRGQTRSWSKSQKMIGSTKTNHKLNLFCLTIILFLSIGEFSTLNKIATLADASVIIGDSAIEIQEVETQDAAGNQQHSDNGNHKGETPQAQQHQQNQVIFGSTDGITGSLDSQMSNVHQQMSPQHQRDSSMMKMPGPLPPLSREDITDGDKSSRNNHDYDINELNLNERQAEKNVLNHVLSASPKGGQEALEDKTIAGKVVDFELTPAGGHNKAKIKKKKKKMAKQSMFKKWGHKKESEKKLHEKKHKESMKKKKEEGHKGKKKWGKEEHGLKKKGNFKKKKWGNKVKKGKGVKKGKKGKKFLKDVGHKNTGFKTVYHKEEWGKSSKWHDIKRQKKWDEKSKKWKKKWKKEKGKKYKGDHMKKFEKKKKSGKKYKKEKEDKFKKFKKEKFEKGKKKKLEEKAKKKESGAKKHMKEMKKKKKQHSG